MWIYVRKTRMEWPCPRDPIKVVNVFAAVTVAESLLPLSMSQLVLVKWRFLSPGSSLGSRSRLPAIFGRRAIFSPPGCCVSGARSTCRPWRRPGWVSSRCVVAAGCAASGRWRALQPTMNLQIQRHISVKFFKKIVLYMTVGWSFKNVFKLIYTRVTKM